jgi:hypothetical protein
MEIHKTPADKNLTPEQLAIRDLNDLVMAVMAGGGFKNFESLDKARNSIQVLKALVEQQQPGNQ